MYADGRKNILPDHEFTHGFKMDLNIHIANTLIENICLILWSFSIAASKITLTDNCSDSKQFLKKNLYTSMYSKSYDCNWQHYRQILFDWFCACRFELQEILRSIEYPTFDKKLSGWYLTKYSIFYFRKF